MEEVEVERTAGGGDDLQMECDEEEQEVGARSPERDEEEGHDEAGISPMEEEEEKEEETDRTPVRIIPLPLQPVPHNTSNLQLPAGPLGFMLNGRLVPLQPGGGGAELKLSSHPGGSASGFTSVQIPITLTVQSPAGTQHISTTASLTMTGPPAAAAAGLRPDPTPIITGVVSGEAAQRVLSNHSVNFKFSPPLTGQKTPPRASTLTCPQMTPPRASTLTCPQKTPPRASTLTCPQKTPPTASTLTCPQTAPPTASTLTCPQTAPPTASTLTCPQTAPPSSRPAPSNRKSKSAVSHKVLLKAQRGPVSPPDCRVCKSQYKHIVELRGFMCLCSPLIAQSLKNLKKKNQKRLRDKNKTIRSPKEPQKAATKRSATSAPKVVSQIQRIHRPPSPVATFSPHVQDQSEAPPDPMRGKLVIMVEDFYYGSAPGRSSVKDGASERKHAGPYRCIHCPRMLGNNIQLMSHMQHHMSSMSEEDGLTDSLFSCPHCFRVFTSSFKLQCHLETVHSQYESTAKCKICELEFGSEPAFLWHMKSTHKPGEMPYVCQVCGFSSSFYSELWSHFEQTHADTKHLLCRYCLRVLRSNTCYQQHFARHQKKNVFSCGSCRLHFLFIRERSEHKLLHHRTHIKPPQLTGLKPGTKVTVRTYSAVQRSESGESLKKMFPCKVVNVEPPPPTQEAPRRKPVERLGPLLSTLSQESDGVGVSQRCVECLSSFQDFQSHFPSLVHCSLCRFITCCSTSYANHMINNHATCRRKPQYVSIFLSEPRLSQKLTCLSCTFTTSRGDVMANHLTERPGHDCIMLTHNALTVTQLTVNGDRTKEINQSTKPADDSSDHSNFPTEADDNNDGVTSPGGQGGGVFIPIHLLPSGQPSPQLSVKPLTSPSSLSSPPAMTIKFLMPVPQPEQRSVHPLSAPQLSAVLAALCHGLPQAARRYRRSPQILRLWICQQERQLEDRMWLWKTEKLAEWVLSQREQQLSVSEDVLLQTATKALGETSRLIDRYSWAIDFLLRHELELQPAAGGDSRRRREGLPRNILDNGRVFTQLLAAQIQSRGVPPSCVACMDEFPVFMDLDQLSNHNLSALRLLGSAEEKPLFTVVLSALSDGTFLPPVLVYRGTSSHLPDGFPDNVVLAAREEGFTDQDCQRVWINKVWCPLVVSQSQSVLMVDVHRGHLTDEFRTSLTSMSTDVFFIPSGCCSRLQPLDVCVTPVLRNVLQARWTQLVTQGGLDGLGLDQLALTLACWLSEVSSTLNSETNVLRRSFASACNLQEAEDRAEAARMIQTLTQTLVQPLETSKPPPGLEPELELLVVMEEEQMEVKEEALSVKSPTALRTVFDGESDQESFHGFQDD